MSSEIIKHPDPNTYWKHRRRLCYIAFFVAIIQTVLLVFLAMHNPDAIVALGSVIGWSYGLYTAIVLAYYGNTAVEEYAKNKKMP